MLKQWAYLSQQGQAFIDKAPPLAPARLAKQATTGTSVTQQAKVRASYARSLDTALRRKGSTEAREDLRRLLSGDLSKGGGNRAVDRLRRRLLTAKKAKAAGMRLATGKTGGKVQGHPWGKDGRRIPRADTAPGRNLQNTAKYSKVHDEGGRVGNGACCPPGASCSSARRPELIWLDRAGLDSAR